VPKEALKSKTIVKEVVDLPQKLYRNGNVIQWTKICKTGDKGFKIMESLLLINDPKLNGTSLITLNCQ
jgi:hypothetical protein